MKMYIYNKIFVDSEVWSLSETFGTIRHMCKKCSTPDIHPWNTVDVLQPCPYCGESCPDMLILGAKIGTFPLPTGD